MNLDTIIEKAKQYELDDEMTKQGEADRQSFVERFPRESLIDLTIEEYADTQSKDAFNYWLENKKLLSGIGGGNASKFGIYRAATGDYCVGFGKKRKVLKGEQLEQELTHIKSVIVQAIELAEEDRVSEISELEIPLFNMVMLKILNIYVPDKFFNIYTPPILIKLGELLDVDEALINPKYSIVLNHEVYKKLKQMSVFSQWSTYQLSVFLWDIFAEWNEKIDGDTKYFLVGHNFGGTQSVRDEFLQQNCISTKFLNEDLTSVLSDDMDEVIDEKEPSSAGRKALKQFFSIKEGDYIALKSTFTKKINDKTKSVLRVSAIGKATTDALDGYRFSEQLGHTFPVEWVNKEIHDHIGYGGYRSTINRVNKRGAIQVIFMEKENGVDEDIEPNLIANNYILYGPPGTGKTYHLVDRSVEIIDPKMYSELVVSERSALQKYFAQLQHDKIIRSITFHQSYAYEDFIEGLKSDGSVNFVPQDGLFKQAAIDAMYEGLNKKKNNLVGYEERKNLVMKALDNQE